MKKFLSSLAVMVAGLSSTVVLADYANDRAEIENISNKYMVAVDAGDIELVMSTWHEDGELVWVFGTENGKDEIRAAMSNFGGARYEAIPEGATSRPRTRHQIINHVIDVDGDTATTTAYWFAMTNRTPQNDVQLLYMGHYEDILVRENGQWLFKSRKVFNESRDNKSLWYPELGEIDPRTKMPPN
jgi:ketosteroid isomerase-like protein